MFGCDKPHDSRSSHITEDFENLTETPKIYIIEVASITVMYDLFI